MIPHQRARHFLRLTACKSHTPRGTRDVDEMRRLKNTLARVRPLLGSDSLRRVKAMSSLGAAPRVGHDEAGARLVPCLPAPVSRVVLHQWHHRVKMQHPTGTHPAQRRSHVLRRHLILTHHRLSHHEARISRHAEPSAALVLCRRRTRPRSPHALPHIRRKPRRLVFHILRRLHPHHRDGLAHVLRKLWVGQERVLTELTRVGAVLGVVAGAATTTETYDERPNVFKNDARVYETKTARERVAFTRWWERRPRVSSPC